MSGYVRFICDVWCAIFYVVVLIMRCDSFDLDGVSSFEVFSTMFYLLTELHDLVGLLFSMECWWLSCQFSLGCLHQSKIERKLQSALLLCLNIQEYDWVIIIIFLAWYTDFHNTMKVATERRRKEEKKQTKKKKHSNTNKDAVFGAAALSYF